jgi:L-iditol 2-dehydrogenase
MKAAVVNQEKKIVVQEFPCPEAGPDEAIVKVKYCGICGSESTPFAEGNMPVGSIIGHELAGEIHQVGSKVDGWHVGQRVVVQGYAPCGVCSYCQRDQPNMCLNKWWIGLGFNPGGLAEYCRVKASMLYAVPDAVSWKEAALVEPLAVALHAVHNAHPNLGTKAVVLGVGAIGLLVLQAAQLAGCTGVVVIDKIPERLELARNLGATAALHLDEANEDSVTQIVGEAPSVVFDCAGAPTSVQFAADIVLRRGLIILVGLSTLPVAIKAKDWSRKELTLKSSMAYTDEFPLALQLIEKKQLSVMPLVSHVVKLDQVDNAMRNMQTSSDYLKVLVEPSLN